MSVRIFTFSSACVAILSIGIAIGFLAQQRNDAPPFSPRPCQGDPALELLSDERGDTSSSFSVDPCHVFSETYWEARQKFRHAAEQVQGAELHALPVLVDGQDDKYTIDIAVLRGSEEGHDDHDGAGGGLLVHTSGVHGVEGYAGSAIQIAFLESVYPMWEKKKKKEESPKSAQRPTIVLIHAVNPYGMANYRRTNEHNVDLNRNGLHPDEWEQVVKGPTGIYAPYEQFSDFFNPGLAPNWLDAFVGLWAKASIPLFKHGFYTLKTAMVTGQYYNPKGIFYGGQKLEPSLSILLDFFQTNILSQQKIAGPITWIDVHTGLGKSGQDTLLMHPEPASDNFQKYMETFFPGAHIPQFSPEAKAVQRGYDKTKGVTPNFFARLFEQQQQQQQSDFLGMVQEFGTVPGVLVAHALILENQAFQNLPSPDQAREWANVTTRRAFYKQTPEWRRSILERGVRLLFQATRRSSSSRS